MYTFITHSVIIGQLVIRQYRQHCSPVLVVIQNVKRVVRQLNVQTQRYATHAPSTVNTVNKNENLNFEKMGDLVRQIAIGQLECLLADRKSPYKANNALKSLQ